MKKDIWIVVIILCVLGLTAVVYKVWKDGKDGLLEKFLNKQQIIENLTNFTNQTLHSNMIDNVSFDYGRQPTQFSGSNGKFEIVVFPNNGQSSYVLRQSTLKTLTINEPIYYRLDFLLKPASYYYFGCLYFSDKGMPLRNLVMFNNTQNVLLKTVHEPNYEYTKAGDFKYQYSLFQTPKYTDYVRTSIYLSYNFNSMKGFNYFTDLGLYELVNENVIPLWDNLRCYFNAFNIDSLDPGYSIIRDLSYHGFDFKASSSENVQKDEINLIENVITGPSAFKLQNSGVIKLTNNFSFLIFVKGSKIYQKQIVESFAAQPTRPLDLQLDLQATPKGTPKIVDNVMGSGTSGETVKTIKTGSALTTDPSKMTIAEFQEIWNKAGCKSTLTEEDVKKWRSLEYNAVIKEIDNYFKLSKDCNGTDAQNNFCLPGKCSKKEGACEDRSGLTYSKLKKPSNTIVTTSAEEMKKEIAKIDGYKLITFPGNQDYGVAIMVPNKYGPIRLIVGGTIFETSIYQLNFLDLLFGVVYDGDKIILYLNGEAIMETASPKIHFEDDRVTINPDSNFYGELYAFAYYNKSLTPQQIRTISRYFVKMRSIGSEVTSVSDRMKRYVNTFVISDFSPDEEGVYASPARIMSIKKTLDSIAKGDITTAASSTISGKIADKCKEIYSKDGTYSKQDLYEKTNKTTASKYAPAIAKALKDNQSDTSSVTSTSSKASTATTSSTGTASTQEKAKELEKKSAAGVSKVKQEEQSKKTKKDETSKSKKNSTNIFQGDGITCPSVTFEEDHYYIIVPPNSSLAKTLGYSGLRDYGTNIDTAKQIFQTNFPKCSVPDILDKNKYKGNLDNCPFIIINDENPCKKFECRSTNWKKGLSDDANCKKSIDTYCTKYANLDNACFCWKPENKDNPKCLQWRGKFENQDRCDFRKADFQKHPDAKNWIRKDKIPCWGCNLTAPESTGDSKCDNQKRPGSGGR